MFESHPKFKLLEQIKLFIFKCVNEDSRWMDLNGAMAFTANLALQLKIIYV